MGAVLLVPITIISNEIIAKYSTWWYVHWLTKDLIFGKDYLDGLPYLSVLYCRTLEQYLLGHEHIFVYLDTVCLFLLRIGRSWG